MIRPLEEKDRDRIHELARMMTEESRFATADYSPAKVDAIITATLESRDIHCLVGIPANSESPDEAVGFFAAIATPDFFLDNLIVSDLAWYVAPEHRGGMTGVRLLKGMMEWAFYSKKADEFRVSVNVNINNHIVDRMLRRFNPKLVTSTYIF